MREECVKDIYFILLFTLYHWEVFIRLMLLKSSLSLPPQASIVNTGD